MTVTTTSPVAGVIRSLSDQSVKLSAALATNTSSAVASSTSNATKAASSVSASIDTQPELNQTIALHLDAINIVFNATKLDVIDSGATQVGRLLGQLQSLATRSTRNGLSRSELNLLNGQFQALRQAINNVPPAPAGSEYPVSSFLKNLGTAAPASVDSTAVLGGFKDTNFLGEGEVTNLLTPEAAQKAVEVTGQGIEQIASQRSTISALQEGADFASASVESALQNQVALKANFDSDEGEETSLAASLQSQAATAQAAQTNRLPSNILQLLG